ncbi:restriction endonuclease subunit S [Modicisalibacter xianhensis]|uniref:Type I restriction enzyme, S subunit n=1 Tax=Modicisalibacter xianhensis TaxID=442341 RepID=A0A1I3B8C9_9GAMM|nr:restriction endonuclease subunit S [Halomonas xianhensis]SFH58482.1 type I restriction enzyme, S subunit [Halomonas xianhensis]
MRQVRYPSYKTTKSTWLASIPEHWEEKRLKDVATYNDESLDEKTDPDFEIEYVDISSVSLTHGIEKTELLAFEKAPSRARRKVRHGDVIVSTVRTYLKAIAPIKNPPLNMVVSTGFAVIRPRSSLDARFAGYMLQSNGFVGDVVANSVGVSYPAINASDLARLPFAEPPLPEQIRISDFLDHKTAQIDALIAKKQSLLDKLAEQRTALISQAVTKGLDPSVPMRNSGVDWVGEIPAHWTVPILGYVAEVRGGVTKGRKLPNEATVEVPYLRVANVQDGFIDLSHVTNIEILVTELERYSLQKGDVLMNEGGDNDKLGRGAVWEGEISPCLHQNHVFAVRPRIPEFSDWLALLTQSGYAKFYFYTTAKQSTNLASISSSNIKKLPVLLPPEAERREIIDHVKTSLDKLTKQRERVIQVIERLKEYRSALITNAVTGKIDVRDFCILTTSEQREVAHG